MTELFTGVKGAIKRLLAEKKTAEEKALVTFYMTKETESCAAEGRMAGRSASSGRAGGAACGNGRGVTVMRKKSESSFLPPERTTALRERSFAAAFMEKVNKPAVPRYSTESELWARETVCRAILAACNPL